MPTSAVFFHTEAQQKLAEAYKKKLDASGAFNAPIVTEITKFKNFYAAEDYHQDYFRLNGRAPYCQAVIVPKMRKFRKAVLSPKGPQIDYDNLACVRSDPCLEFLTSFHTGFNHWSGSNSL